MYFVLWKINHTKITPFAELTGKIREQPPLLHPTFRVLQGLLIQKAISPHLDKVNVCFDFANGGF